MLTFLKFSRGDIAPDSTRSWGLVKTWHFWCDTRADETSANVSTLIARIGRVERSAEVAETHCAATGDWERPWEWIYHRRRHSIWDCKTTATRTTAVYSVDGSIDQSRPNSLQNCNCPDYETVWGFDSTKARYIIITFHSRTSNNFEFKIHRIGRRTIRLS